MWVALLQSQSDDWGGTGANRKGKEKKNFVILCPTCHNHVKKEKEQEEEQDKVVKIEFERVEKQGSGNYSLDF